MRKRDIRKLPEQKSRVETGAVQFGDDWPGLFVRGDDCMGLAFLLEQTVRAGLLDEWSSVYGLISTIRHDVTGGGVPPPYATPDD